LGKSGQKGRINELINSVPGQDSTLALNIEAAGTADAGRVFTLKDLSIVTANIFSLSTK